MDSALFNLGDVVALKSHPYYENLTGVIISGDAISISPLMIVTEVFKAKQHILGKTAAEETFKYKCSWFSTKSFQFHVSIIIEPELKIIQKNSANICPSALEIGKTISLKSSLYELAKLKSHANYEDKSYSDSKNVNINSLLTFLPPIMQITDLKKYEGKEPLTKGKTGEKIRIAPYWIIKCSYFNPSNEKFTETALPLEALTLIESTDIDLLNKIKKAISESVFLKLAFEKSNTIIKPKHISYRNGIYFLNGFDLLLNKTIEIIIDEGFTISEIKNPYELEVPKFNIEHTPEAITRNFIIKEINDAIQNAQTRSAYIRIKYKNINDAITIRTLKNYKLVKAIDDSIEIPYLVAFCLLRQAERTFRIDKIQSLQEIKLSFK